MLPAWLAGSFGVRVPLGSRNELARGTLLLCFEVGVVAYSEPWCCLTTRPKCLVTVAALLMVLLPQAVGH
mgnify:CR=1 FL=1